jgi:GWxTD domain-containing protein
MFMNYFSLVVFLIISITGLSQKNYPLRDINGSLLYDPSQPVTFSSRVSRTPEGFEVFYKLSWKDTASQIQIQWEVRKTLGDETGVPVAVENINETRSDKASYGKVEIPKSVSNQIVLARVTDYRINKAWWFYRVLEENYPANGIIKTGEEGVVQPFIHTSQPIKYEGPGTSIIVSYYNDNFPTAAPAFSEGQAKVSKMMKHDSIFSIVPGENISFSEPGLYLLQQDTMAAEGVSFRVEDDYPRLQKIQSLADPLIYICTKGEFERVKAAKGDKKAFDKVILSITGDTERARNFMRSYFRRVELANLYFTSYKEGWKTDRGMMYIIFGLPDVVHRLSDREIWTYKSATVTETFTFAKSGTIFDPDNFVLIRDKKYQETWYDVVDLWRNARF